MVKNRLLMAEKIQNNIRQISLHFLVLGIISKRNLQKNTSKVLSAWSVENKEQNIIRAFYLRSICFL